MLVCISSAVGNWEFPAIFQIETTNLKLLPTLRWRCAECEFHHERNVREEQHHIYVARTSNNRVIVAGEL